MVHYRPQNYLMRLEKMVSGKLAITDINSTAGHIEMMRVCRERAEEYFLELALGIEFWQDGQLKYIGIAQNNQGYQELNRFLSHHNQRGLPLLSRAPDFEKCFYYLSMGAGSRTFKGP